MIQKKSLSKFKIGYENLVTRTLGMIWFMNIKENVIYHSILIDKGFLKREGFYYNLSQSTIIFDIKFQKILIYYLQTS